MFPMLKKWIKNKIVHSPYMIRILRDRDLFEYFQSQGIHVVKNHFYKPVPDTRQFTKDFFQHRYNWEGVDLNDNEQTDLLKQFITSYRQEYSTLPFKETEEAHQYYWDNGGFQCLDAVSL